MNTYKIKVEIEADVPAYSAEDALDVIMDGFGPGQYTACEITDTKVKILDAN